MQRDFLAGFDRLIERGEQLETLAPLEAIHQRRALMHQTVDDMLIIGLMAEAVDVRKPFLITRLGFSTKTVATRIQTRTRLDYSSRTMSMRCWRSRISTASTA
jgi:hypothetical protein